MKSLEYNYFENVVTVTNIFLKSVEAKLLLILLYSQNFACSGRVRRYQGLIIFIKNAVQAEF